MATKKPTNEQTSARVASTASKLLSNPRTSAAVKSVAASALTQKVSSGKYSVASVKAHKHQNTKHALSI
jgi:hypothetical protein